MTSTKNNLDKWGKTRVKSMKKIFTSVLVMLVCCIFIEVSASDTKVYTSDDYTYVILVHRFLIEYTL